MAMASSAPSTIPSTRPRWNSWAAWMTVTLAASTSWISGSNAAALSRREVIAGGVDLKVLPIGDSITYGAPNPPYNGYRKPLWERLHALENKLDFVGSLNAGDFPDGDNEGHRGEIIAEIAAHSLEGIYEASNIVLLHAGTNDIFHNKDPDGAPDRLVDLIDLIFSKNANAVIFVCKIIPASPVKHATTAAKIPAFNAKIPGIVESFTSRNKKVVMVDMNKDFDPAADLVDGLHPNTQGYAKMAERYYNAIIQAAKDGKISKPGTPSKAPATNCRAEPLWYNVGLVAEGAKAAYTDGNFKPKWAGKKIIHDGNCKRAQLRFMDLDGDGLKDYACVDPDTGKTKVALRDSVTGDWGEMKTVATGAKGRNGTGVMFADINGDGRDDYIYVDPRSGSVSAWINREWKGDEFQWEGLGEIAHAAVGATSQNLQMVDLNGDGRADFCIVSPTTGEMTAWINTGADKLPDYHKLGIVGTGASVSSKDKAILGDFTGNGRADYMIVHDDGTVSGLVNRLQETSLAPRWLPVAPIGPDLSDDDVDQDSVRLVDMDGNGQVDHLAIGQNGKVTFRANLGTGGKYQIGEGVFLVDLDGDGVNDYFWIDHDGNGWGYLNIGRGEDKWYGLGPIAKPIERHHREKVRMGRLTSSGRADYIVVEEESGACRWWQNLGEDYDYSWAYRGEAATGPGHTIRNVYGWKFRAKNVRFADLDGDGLDDYLYVNEEGITIYWKNLGTGSATGTPTWGPAQKVAHPKIAVLPQDVQFADTNGDSHNDYLVVGRVTGRTNSWHWLGWEKDDSIRWNTPLPFADGVGSVGSAIKIVEMTGDGRADYVSVDPDTGRLNLWKNRCWEITDDDPEPSPPYTGHSQDDWCGSRVLKSGFTASQKADIWGSEKGQLGVGTWLDEQITSLPNKEINWLDHLRDSYEDKLKGISTFQCNSIAEHAECTLAGLTCDQFWEAEIAPLYWVFRTVSNLNNVMGQTNTDMTSSVLQAALDIEDIDDKFGHPKPDTTAMDIFISALAGGAALSAASAPATGIFGGLGALVTLTSNLGAPDEENDRLVAEEALNMLYTSTRRGLRALLYLAVEGRYDDKDTDDANNIVVHKKLTSSDLPNLDDASYTTNIAKYFQDGQWLIDTDKLAHDMDTWEQNFVKSAHQAIITGVLKSQRWFVFIDEDKTTEADCSRTSGTNNDGRRLINGECADMFVFLLDSESSGEMNSADSQADSKFKALKELKYGAWDLEAVYQNALDCALRFPDGSGALAGTNLELVGDYPVCFFSFPVVRGRRFKDTLDEWNILKANNEPYINTSGRDLW